MNKKSTIALIADELTSKCLEYEANVYFITPLNYKFVLHFFKPDFLFVESTWHGKRDAWKFKIASYPEHPKRNNKILEKVVNYAKKLNIPTVFWNKEDGVHFERFIESAKLFDHIFTVDENCLSKYRAVVDARVTVNTLMFAVQAKIHYFSGFNFKYKRANFVGSYSHHIHDRRRFWQDMFFHSTSNTGLGLSVYDRNSSRKSSNYRYPKLSKMDVNSAVQYADTAQIYKDYFVSLNVNTIEDSETMFSRRLVEIIGCGGIAVTNPSPAVEKYFKEYCYVVHDEKEANDLFDRIKYGLSDQDLQRARAGAAYVAKEHTWSHRIQEIYEVIGIRQ
ncbi:MAG: glycosyltransferase [Sulfuricurvum sp.]|uniref:CgeB family protein n=1 Tax=Sulfuricurvum sp. TaxID=2025608 RepID=UPI002614DF02|nr:glycosyltransferase [Sulfuricurvum sp.]MDD5159926.1 glycosyltransferase [Sulfuricurvum sp.]